MRRTLPLKEFRGEEFSAKAKKRLRICDVEFPVLVANGHYYLPAKEMAAALGTDESRVGLLYRSNPWLFADQDVEELNLEVDPGSRRYTRCFSLPAALVLAAMSGAPNYQRFCRQARDVLEEWAQTGCAEHQVYYRASDLVSRFTDPDRTPVLMSTDEEGMRMRAYDLVLEGTPDFVDGNPESRCTGWPPLDEILVRKCAVHTFLARMFPDFYRDHIDLVYNGWGDHPTALFKGIEQVPIPEPLYEREILRLEEAGLAT